MLQGKHIMLGVTGGIAAYKAAELVSLLGKAGAEVEVIMTAAATKFITPLTFTTLSRHDTHCDMFAPFSCTPQHIGLAERGDIFIVAPATGNTLAKIAHGIADNLLSSTLLACRAPLLVAPAMNNNMWEHPATQANLELLRARGVHFVGPIVGNLACGVRAIGKMAEPADILAAAAAILTGK